jgi:hypothetical protein
MGASSELSKSTIKMEGCKALLLYRRDFAEMGEVSNNLLGPEENPLWKNGKNLNSERKRCRAGNRSFLSRSYFFLVLLRSCLILCLWESESR